MEWIEGLKVFGHFFISLGIVWILKKKRIPLGIAFILAFGLGLSKEIFDVLNHPTLHFEWEDVHVNLIGCTLGSFLSV